MNIAPVAAVKPGALVAHMVVLGGMPGEGVYDLHSGAQVGPAEGWSSLDAAKAAATQLAAGDAAGAVALFKSGANFTAFTLLAGNQAYNANDDAICRTPAGRNLVAVIDDTTPDIVSASEFRSYARQANAGG